MRPLSAIGFSLLALGFWACSVVNAPDDPVDPDEAGGSTSSQGGSSVGAGGTAPGCGDGMVDSALGETCDPPGTCPNCDDGDACTTNDQQGTPNACNVVCNNAAITVCEPLGDGCCPAGSDGMTDADCGSCGNNVVELGETCDGNCPATCDDMDSCTTDTQAGDATNCDLVCTNTAITTCTGGDACCPMGCDLTNDGDCVMHASCTDLLTNMPMWGQAATGLDLRAWTGSTLHWIGCAYGCTPASWYCNFDPVNQVLAFGTTENNTVRAVVDPNNAMGDTMPTNTGPGCCSAAVPSDVCNAPDNVDGPVNSAAALCSALGYVNGQLLSAVNSNSCPEPYATNLSGLSWTSDFASSPGYGRQWQCSGFK